MNTEDKRRFQAITGSVMCLGQVTRYDIGYAVNQLARAMSKPSKAHMAAAKHLLRYPAGTTNFAITYKRWGFKLTAFSDANWGNNPDNGKSTSSYVAFLSNDPVSFKELVKEEIISIHYVKTEDQLADIGTKHLSKHRHRYLIKLIGDFKA